MLNTVHENFEHISVKFSIILQLHLDLYKFNGGEAGGKFKITDNVIEETDFDGNCNDRFKTVPVWERAESITALCDAYDRAINNQQIDPLLVIPVFILDFLCIHPFSGGNGRMSRILITLPLYKAGYIVGKYISLERIIEKTKASYYDTLQESSVGWYEEANNYTPFVEYTLGIVLSAYREFSERVNVLTKDLSKPERVREVIMNKTGKITKKEIIGSCPDISRTTIVRTLVNLQNTNEIKKTVAVDTHHIYGIERTNR